MSKIETMPLEDKTLSLVGDYWVGDPCYVFSDKDWSKLCGLMFPNGEAEFDDSNTVRVVRVDGKYCFLFGTAHGDGCYPLREGRKLVGELGVDAGMLSMIPVALLKKKGWGENQWLGTVVTLNGSVEKIGVTNGDFHYGKYKIKTDW